MGFLSGGLSFERYWIHGDAPQQFGPEHLETLERFAIGQLEIASPEEPNIGFLAGEHMFDLDFSLEKNVIGDMLHFGVRIDTNQIPAAIRRAWIQMELAALLVETPDARPTKSQRQEAKEAVDARCQDEAKSGKYRRMQQFPMLWDLRSGVLYFGGTSGVAGKQCAELFERAFDLELDRITAGKLAAAYAGEHKLHAELNELEPAVFHTNDETMPVTWWNGQSDNYDYLGNEFLLWLWWHFEIESDTLELPDGSELSGMFARTLSLECPQSESGKESITAASPIHLPEAELAIRSGKLPRKAGLTLARCGEQYDFALQAETFTVGSAKIQAGEGENSDDMREERLDSLRGLADSVDQLFEIFCARRINKAWKNELKKMRRWLQNENKVLRKPAA